MDQPVTIRPPETLQRAVDLPSHLNGPPTSSSLAQHWRGLVTHHYLACAPDSHVALPRLECDLIIVPLTPVADCKAQVDGVTAKPEMTPGRIAVLPRKTASTWRWAGRPELMFLAPERLVLQEIAASMTEQDPHLVALRGELGASSPLIHEIAREMKAELQGDGLHGLIYAETLIQTLCAHLVLRHSVLGGGGVTVGGLDDKRLKRAVAYILDHLAEDISIEAVAKVVHLSPYHFARAFKISTGRPPHQFVIERRIERAKQMLQTTKLQTGAIAAACGFSSQSHFTILFRRRTGLTPSVYRDAR